METLLNKLEEASERVGRMPGIRIDVSLEKQELETIISLLKGSNQPSGEGVKPPESYLQGMESVYSPTSIGANYSESDVIKALTAQARDYENLLCRLLNVAKSVCADMERGDFPNASLSFEEVSCAIIEIEDPVAFKDTMPESFSEEDMLDFGAACVDGEFEHHVTAARRTPVEELLTQFRNDRSKPKE